MKTLLTVLLFLSAGALHAATVRVVSQTVHSDELLLSLADPGQIAALSHLAKDPNFCGLTEKAKPYPTITVNCDAEAILKHRPTLVIFADFSRIELVEQVRRTGVDILIFKNYATLEDSFANLRALAKHLGPEAVERAEKIIAGTQVRVDLLAQKLKDAPRIKVMAPSIYGFVPGYDTTFQDICEHAGAENLAATIGKLKGHAQPPNEQMLTWPVEYLVIAGYDIDKAMIPYKKLPPYQYMAAYRKKKIVLLEPWQISCVSHLRVEAYEYLARQLHPQRF